jgi:hypothetical protein
VSEFWYSFAGRRFSRRWAEMVGEALAKVDPDLQSLLDGDAG